MISELLNRQFVLARMKQLEAASRTQQDDESLRATLAEALPRGPEEHLLPQAAPGGRQSLLGERYPASPATPIDEVSFFSRDAVTSLVQSALEQYYEEVEPDLVQGEPGGGRHFLVAENEDSPQRAFGEFQITDPIWLSDPGWVNSRLAKMLRLYRGKHSFRDEPATPVTMQDDARLVLVGDWGTGLKQAQGVAAEMRKVLEEGKAQGRQQHVVHLGDVYYSGWKREYEARFLPYWPVQPGEKSDGIVSWVCNANHDMYSGGHAYFDYLLADERFALQEQSSYFSLENEHWQILGLDTAWEDHDLKDPQASWVEGKLRDHPNRKTMLLSHHQLFSAYEGDGPKLRVKLRGALETDRIDAWFWGHEHRCVLYKPHERVRFGRCIGHGGVPVYPDNGLLPEPAFYQYREYFDAGWEDWALCGFSVLDFQGPQIRARYVDEFGRTHKEETIE